MKKSNRNPGRKFIYILLISLFVCTTMSSQIEFPDFDDVDDEVPGAPIDGLIGLGLAAGVLYGVRKLKGKK